MKISVKNRTLEVNSFLFIRDFQPYHLKMECGQRSLSSIPMRVFFGFPRKTLFREISDFLRRRYIYEKKNKGESGHTHHTHTTRAHTAE